MISKYLETFVANGYDNQRLIMNMTTDDLDEMKITIPGHRKLLLMAAGDLRSGTSLPLFSLSFYSIGSLQLLLFFTPSNDIFRQLWKSSKHSKHEQQQLKQQK